MIDDLKDEKCEAPKAEFCTDDSCKEHRLQSEAPPTVPLFQIPDAVLNSMSKEVAPDTAQIQNPVEWIMKQRKMAEAQVTAPKENTPPAPQVAPVIQIPSESIKKNKVPKVAWGGNDLNEEALTMLFYMVVKEISKDKKIKKYLKGLNIEIYDINDELLWP